MSLRDENEQLRSELSRLRQVLHKHGLSCDLPDKAVGGASTCPMPTVNRGSFAECNCNHTLNKQQIERYSRHLLLPSFGLAAQQSVCSSSVLVVGCGGLGSPAALYLAAAGIGTLGLMDHDEVEASNLHRQIIHTEGRVGMHKASSATAACRALNSTIQVRTHGQCLTAANALEVIRQYDVVLDCSDNPPTRYLISDACVVAGKPLVSAAAVGTDGQLTVYNFGEDGPCYRCLFPESPSPENCSRCSDAGVLGVVPGIMGSLQALEAIKIVSGKGNVLSRRLLIFDALSGRFMNVKLRARNPSCAACGDDPIVTDASLPNYGYKEFTGQEAQDGPPPPLEIIPDSERLLPVEAKAVLDSARASGSQALVLDVRPKAQFELFHLPGSINIPIEELVGEFKALSSHDLASISTVLVICRRGNASQRAVEYLRSHGIHHAKDVIGGLNKWASDLDGGLPIL